MKAGIAYLVGAGPGDPGLLTVKGWNCLTRADVVIYDYLVNSELLGCAGNASEFIYVGKQADRHAMEQHEINALLVKKVQEGQTVVRLKGGDPFLFGRGAEEALELAKAGIPFEIVPGVTAATGASAYAGFPLTHREHNSVVSLVTGHEDPTKKESAINWSALAAGGGTLVFYMGVKNLPNIAEKLINGGRSPETPAALIRWGTLPQQRVVAGILSNIAETAKKAEMTPPCILVVGNVVELREKLNWFETRPLFGKTIMITRSREQASSLAAKLAALGAQVLSMPTIRFAHPEDDAPLKDAVNALFAFDWIVFTSVNAVDQFFSTIYAEGHDSRQLSACKTCCVGPGTASRLAGYGIESDLIPPSFTSKAVFDALSGQEDLNEKRMLLPRADIAGADLPAMFEDAGAEVTDIVVYKTLPGDPPPEVIESLRAGEVDIVTFTSSSTAKNFASITNEKLGSLPHGIKYASIGPETSKAAREEGMEIAVEAQEHTIDGLVNTIVDKFASIPSPPRGEEGQDEGKK